MVAWSIGSYTIYICVLVWKLLWAGLLSLVCVCVSERGGGRFWSQSGQTWKLFPRSPSPKKRVRFTRSFIAAHIHAEYLGKHIGSISNMVERNNCKKCWTTLIVMRRKYNIQTYNDIAKFEYRIGRFRSLSWLSWLTWQSGISWLQWLSGLSWLPWLWGQSKLSGLSWILWLSWLSWPWGKGAKNREKTNKF